MAIRIVVSNRVGFKVKGSINNESGNAEPFEFSLVADRLDADALQEATRGDRTQPEFMESVVVDWQGVKDEEGAPVPFSLDALRQLCKIPGLAAVMFFAYLAEVGARAKN